MARVSKILILEDDPSMREAMGEVLVDEGYQVVLAQRGEEAVNKAALEDFDLVVSDIKMPGMSGLEAVEKMREQQPAIKTMIVSGYCSEANTLRAVKMGVSDFFKKPFRLDDFLHRVKQILDERLQEVRRHRRIQELQTASLSSLRLLATFLDDEPEKALTTAASTALKLLTDVPDENGRYQAEAVTLLAALGSFAPEFPAPNFGAEVAEMVAQADERWDGSGPQGLAGANIPLPSRIASLALFSAKESMERAPEGHFDPVLVAALGRPSTGAQEGSESSRRLLALAQTMELANDLETAHRAYLELVEGHAGSREELSARLGLLRIAQLAGDLEALEDLSKAARAAAEEAGALSLAETELELGLLLLTDKPAQGRQYLAAAHERLQELEAQATAAQAELALVASGAAWSEKADAAVELLSRPAHTELFSRSAEWLLPTLLEHGHPAGQSLLRQEPAAILPSLDSGQLSAPAKLRALDAFRVSGPPASGAVLRRLAQDQDPGVKDKAGNLVRTGGVPDGPPTLKLFTFGKFEVYFGDERLPDERWQRKKIRSLMAYLARCWRAPLTEDRLLEEFWPGPIDRAKRSLYQATWELRRSLKQESWPGLDYIRRKNGFFSLQENVPFWSDLQAFEQALDSADDFLRQDKLELAAPHYREAVKLARGPYLEECYEDWALVTRESAQKRLLRAHEGLSRLALTQQNFREGLEQAQALVSLDSLNQQGHLLVMDACIGLGQPEEAIRQFQSCERLLRNELGIEPSIDMIKCYHRAQMGLSGPAIG